MKGANDILESLQVIEGRQSKAESGEPATGERKAEESEYDMIRQARNIQDNSQTKYRRRSKRSMVGQRCHSCNTTNTPEWRRGPDGARTLCNACGLHYSKLLRKGSLMVQSSHTIGGPYASSYLQSSRFSEMQMPEKCFGNMDKPVDY
ncbi:GATA zinc finger-domain-containing protein [Phycomyces nitens]|nr:GATA zinc finger-domain-containing protein [Phycomyces nitens]